MTIAGLICAVFAASGLFNVSAAGLDAWMAGQQGRSFAERLAETARFALGTPYADGPLGEGPGGTHDTDPLIDLTRADCVTYIEQCVALAASEDFESAVALLQRIRYRDGEIGYEQRHHFFVTDWLEHNTWARDVTRDQGVPTRTVTRTISRKGFFGRVNAAGLGGDTPDRQVELAYIPIETVLAGLPRLPDRAIITFVGKIDWLFALHCGLYLAGPGAPGLLHHASSKEGRAVAVPLETYCAEQRGRYLGILVHEVREPAFARP